MSLCFSRAVPREKCLSLILQTLHNISWQFTWHRHCIHTWYTVLYPLPLCNPALCEADQGDHPIKTLAGALINGLPVSLQFQIRLTIIRPISKKLIDALDQRTNLASPQSTKVFRYAVQGHLERRWGCRELRTLAQLLPYCATVLYASDRTYVTLRAQYLFSSWVRRVVTQVCRRVCRERHLTQNCSRQPLCKTPYLAAVGSTTWQTFTSELHNLHSWWPSVACTGGVLSMPTRPFTDVHKHIWVRIAACTVWWWW